MGSVPAGEAFSPGQQEQINRAIGIAERQSGLRFAAYVGPAPVSEGARDFARTLHHELPDRAKSVLVYVDPAHRALEIVTGTDAARVLDARALSLAVVAMTSTFAIGDLAGGIADGLLVLGEHARHPEVLHRTL